MAILVACGCGQQFLTADENVGRQARCLVCGAALTVPPPLEFADNDLLRFELINAPPWSGRAIASFTMGVISLGFAFFAGVPAIVLGVHAIKEIRQSRGRIRGVQLAMAGIALGLIGSTAISAALFLGLFVSGQESAQEAQCINNLKQIGLAMHNYHAANGTFPAAAIIDRTGKPLLSWRVAILPYLGSQGAALYAKFNLTEPWDGPENSRLLWEMPAVFACPADPSTKRKNTGYQVLIGPKTVFPGLRSVGVGAITDGTSNTILVGECDLAVPWTAPQDLPFDSSIPYSGMGSFHPDKLEVLFADGSVRTIHNTVSMGTLGALISRNGGEIISGGY